MTLTLESRSDWDSTIDARLGRVGHMQRPICAAAVAAGDALDWPRIGSGSGRTRARRGRGSRPCICALSRMLRTGNTRSLSTEPWLFGRLCSSSISVLVRPLLSCPGCCSLRSRSQGFPRSWSVNSLGLLTFHISHVISMTWFQIVIL